ncbi:MAG: DUF362 domain-containing protein [Candidatus Bathyarchaeota archaeon]
MSSVIVTKVIHEPMGVQNAVRKTLEALEWLSLLHGKKVFVKVNLISSEFVPGQCTSPLVLDGLFSELSKHNYDITFGDADLAAAHQCNKAARVWGHLKLAEKYGARFQNLSEDEMVKTQINGKVFQELDIPRTIIEADSIISIPVLKTHCLTGLTCALKHFWGVVPRVRHQYHLVVDDAIADINTLVKPKMAFTLVDGTIGMEGNAPRTGIPKLCDLILASSDPVALDAAAAKYMGLDIPKHVKTASERGLGSLKYNLIGNELETNPFEPPEPDQQPIFFWEMKLRQTFLKPLLFDTPIFNVLSWIATKYNTFYYYQRYGKKYTKETMNTSWYGEQLRNILL